MATRDPFDQAAEEPMQTDIDGGETPHAEVATRAKATPKYHVFQAMPLEGTGTVWVQLTGNPIEAPSKKAAVKLTAATEERREYMVVPADSVWHTPYGYADERVESWD